MKRYKILFLLTLAAATGCKKFEEFQINPNNPTVADPSLLLPAIERTAFSTISADAALASRYLVYTQSVSNSQYYGWQRSGMGYGSISQVMKMEQEAARVGKKNYRYIGKFFTSYFIISMTQTFGDIPYSKMMQSIRNNNFTDTAAIRPGYDKQQDVYKGALDELKIASDSLSAADVAIAGDLVYAGNIERWKKLINSFTLRVLMSLSKKEAEASLNIKQRFNEIISNPAKYPLLASNSDNGRLPYYDITGNQYPYFNNNSMKTDYYLDSTFVDILQDLKDPRLFVFGKPKPSGGLPVKDFNGYDGLKGSASLSYNTAKRGAGNASQINDRYAYQAINEPSVLMSYAELQFILAEAVVRGWITGDAATYYKNGIKASLDFSNYNNTYTATEINDYLAQAGVALQAGQEVKQIITQKYISMFMNTGWQPFYEQRRTGFPALDVSGSGILNGGVVPRRWMYPNDEYTNNRVNVENAVKAQYPGGDNINGTMWILQ
ncbi:SusD/RagB family nutrient-binding outer membrane lipoprotein [Paraflavitalea sp. CAU 1676]|uniref:SusD/RagB family nutrient-binding outer membrane lipoprotein n=1 Tax=Paraflavitalea sp. CAU 1676 TaxID=3032598 RepID=UPI0023DBC9E1|nr:SusD/RagB family nutrient-binding outer membrane lipoprotein [Paraflavitalea sp. CAU 1676]MDF2193526.1 SusD/RagB family nutrient-binding outer membrane lipoprotein [Paraflavitalea sp. CAU 1676]